MDKKNTSQDSETLKEMNFATKMEVKYDIIRIEDILASQIFRCENSSNPLFASAIVEIMIRLRDLLYKSEKFGHRVEFSDDLIACDKVADITDSIKYVRDAINHIDSENNRTGETISICNVIFGKGICFRIGDKEFGSDYDDEIRFFYGSQGLYLNRHIIRAFEEARNHLSPFLGHSFGVQMRGK